MGNFFSGGGVSVFVIAGERDSLMIF